MNIGTISTRYSKALLSLAAETHQEEPVYNNMRMLKESFASEPSLRSILLNPTISKEDKKKLLITAGGINVCELFERFIDLVLQNNRENVLIFIAYVYIHRYRRSKKITRVKFDTAVSVTDQSKELLVKKLEAETGCVIEFSGAVKPELIGGFVLRIGNYRYDASYAMQLKQIHKQLSKR